MMSKKTFYLEEKSSNDRDRVVKSLLLLCFRQESIFHEQTEEIMSFKCVMTHESFGDLAFQGTWI